MNTAVFSLAVDQPGVKVFVADSSTAGTWDRLHGDYNCCAHDTEASRSVADLPLSVGLIHREPPDRSGPTNRHGDSELFRRKSDRWSAERRRRCPPEHSSVTLGVSRLSVGPLENVEDKDRQDQRSWLRTRGAGSGPEELAQDQRSLSRQRRVQTTLIGGVPGVVEDITGQEDSPM
ncbi:unnamed protein product [Arctogadus glacialis]